MKPKLEKSDMVEGFELGDRVKIKVSGEEGYVDGLAVYLNSPPSIYIHYQAADGRACSSWWCTEQIEKIAAVPQIAGG